MATGWVPTFNEATIALFDGGLSYEYPIAVPDGVGGLVPDLSLTYNSRRVDGIVSWVQSDWLGLGWTVDTIEIVRELFRPDYTSYPGGNPNWANGGVKWGNRYSLLYKGTRYPLIPSTPNGRGRYHTQDEQFVYVERRNNSTICGIPGNPSPLNETGEYWLVRLRDGTELRLGYTENAEQAFYTRYTSSQALEYDPDVPESYVGRSSTGRVAYRWRVDTITSTQGITIGFTYDEEEVTGSDYRERASYLSTIRYNRARAPAACRPRSASNAPTGRAAASATAPRPGIRARPTFTRTSIWTRSASITGMVAPTRGCASTGLPTPSWPIRFRRNTRACSPR
jgi:hypothetical protein